MFEEHGLGYYGAEAAATCKTGGGREEMDEKDHEIAHFRILTTKRKLAEFRANQQFARDRLPKDGGGVAAGNCWIRCWCLMKPTYEGWLVNTSATITLIGSTMDWGRTRP